MIFSLKPNPIANFGVVPRRAIIQASLAFTAICVVISGFQLFGISPDFLDYAMFFDFADLNQLDTFGLSRFEPGFIMSTLFLLTIFSSPVAVYTGFLAVSVFLKSIVFYSFSTRWQIFIAVAFLYMMRFFSVHEYTQIRASLAIAFVLVGTLYLWDGRSLKAGIFALLAILFHQSSAALIPFLLVKSTKRRTTLILWVGTALFLKFSATFLVSNFLVDTVEIVATYEQKGSFAASGVSLTNPTIWLDVVLILYGFANWNQLTKTMKASLFMGGMGIAFYFGMYDFPVMAHRLREFFSVYFLIFIIESFRLNIIRTPVIIYYIISSGVFFYLFYIRDGFFS